jgi:glycosyltransferase involved in cell wall biosynthesis
LTIIKPKLIRITTVPLSLEKLLENQLRFMNSFFEVTAVSSEKKRLEEFGREQGVHTFHVDLTRKITPFKDLKAVFKLYKFFKKEKPSIVHTHTPKAGIVGMLASKLACVPIRMHTVAGLPLMETSGIKRSVLNIVEKLTYSCATNVYPNSKGLKEFIIKENLTSERKLKILGNGSSNGIDTTHFSPNQVSDPQKRQLRTDLNISENDFVFVFVGRLVGDKGINELVEVFTKMSKTHTNTKLVLVGPLETDLDPLEPNTLNEIEWNKEISYVGFQNDVRPYFAISDVLVFLSYREGFPNVVMQAGAMGLLSIVTDINGCNEIIKSGVNGIIIPVKDIQATYNAMRKLVMDQSYYDKLQGKSKEMIVNKYSQTELWNTLLKEYNSFLEFNINV